MGNFFNASLTCRHLSITGLILHTQTTLQTNSIRTAEKGTQAAALFKALAVIP